MIELLAIEGVLLLLFTIWLSSLQTQVASLQNENERLRQENLRLLSIVNNNAQSGGLNLGCGWIIVLLLLLLVAAMPLFSGVATF
jgi:hypothetical protein